MGKSAKLHKRVQNKKTTPNPQPKPVAPSVQSSKKRAGLKSKAKARSGTEGGHVLGGADYVTLMLGGRRKAADEATKLPGERT